MKHTPKTSPALADITSEQIILSPEQDGIVGIPAVSHSLYRTNWQALPPHVHGDVEICFCSRGSLVFECEGTTHTLLPNNVFLTQPGDRHHLVTNHKGMRMYWLFFRYPRRGGTVLGLSVAETSELIRRLKTITPHVFAVDVSVRQLFRDIFRQSNDLPRGAYRTLVLKTLILKVLMTVIESAGNKPTVKAFARISQIADSMRQDPSRHYAIRELAARADLSESRFTALFRQVVGLPPYAYLADCRLKAAKERIASTDDTIRQIAQNLGYASPQHLATQFRKTYGLTARDWRQSAKRPSR